MCIRPKMKAARQFVPPHFKSKQTQIDTEDSYSLSVYLPPFFFSLSFFSSSSSSKARSLLALMHPPCSGRSEWHRHNGDATVKANEQTADGWMMSMLDWWRSSDSVQPVYLRHQLFRRLGSFRFDLAQVKQLELIDFVYNNPNVQQQQQLL